jgi:hypothetical protein
MTPRKEILDILHRYRLGEIKLAEEAADQIIEACAVAAEQQDRTGREWVKDSLWHNILNRAGASVRALKGC